MNEKPVKYELHIRGKSSSFHNTPFKIDLSSTTAFPSFRVGDYIAARSFDWQYEYSDRTVVLDVLWDFLSNEDASVIHQTVILHDEPSDAEIERNSRMKEHDV